MVEVTASNGGVFLISESDLIKVNRYKWYITGHGYVARTDKKIYLHRWLMNANKGEIVDHKNGNTLDNTRKNLRICTQKQNMYNSKKLNPCYKHGKGWVFKIRYGNNKIYNSKVYKTKEECEVMYNRIIMKLHGEFAKTLEKVIDNGEEIVPYKSHLDNRTSNYKYVSKISSGKWKVQRNKIYYGIFESELDAYNFTRIIDKFFY